MLALVVKGKILPQPPVQRMTALAVMARILPGGQLDGHHALTPSVVHEQLGDEELVVSLDDVVLERGLEQRVEQVEAGLVGGEPRPLDLHPAEGAHGDVAVRLPAPGAAPVLEPQHLLRRLPHEGLHRVLVAEPVPSGDGVVGVLVEAVRRLDHGGGAALRGDGVAPHGIHLGDHGDAEPRMRLGHRDGRAQAGPAAPDHEHVAGVEIHQGSGQGRGPGRGGA